MKQNLTRRGFLMLATSATVGSVLAACSPAPAPTPAPQAPEATTAPAEAATIAPEATAAPVEAATAAPEAAEPAPSSLSGEVVTVFHYGQWDDEAFGPRAQRFNEKYPNIKLTSINANGDAPYVQKITTMAAGGTPPDLMVSAMGRMVALGATGVYEDLGPRIDASALMQRIGPQLPGKGPAIRFLGKQYGVPYNQNFNLYFYNKDIFDEKGVAYPKMDWTWDDVITLGQKIVDTKNSIYFVDPGTTSFNPLGDRFWGAGTTIFSEDFTHFNFDQEANIAALKFWVELYTQQKVCPSPELKLGEMGFSFETGKMAMARVSIGDTLPIQLGPKPTWAFNWGATLPPAGPKAQVVNNSLNLFCLGKGAKGADLAWEFITWELDDEEQTIEAKEGTTVSRGDILQAVTISSLREDLREPLKGALESNRSMELCPAWAPCQTIYNQEMAPAYLGRITPEEGAANTYAKGQPALEETMKQLGLM